MQGAFLIRLRPILFLLALLASQAVAQSPPPLSAPEAEQAALQALAEIEGLKDEAVEITDDTLTIAGTADDEAVRRQAQAAAIRATGLGDIDNQIGLSLNVEDRTRGAANRLTQRAEIWVGYLPLIPLALGILLAFTFFAWITGKLTWPFRQFTKNPFLQDIFRKVTQTAIMLIGVLLALEVLDAMALVGGVLGAAGVAGIAIGFAFKDLIENYIASVLLSLRQPFRHRDHVIIDNHQGLVSAMNTRTTVLTTFDGNIVRIPNAVVFKTTLINYSTDPRRRLSFTVGVGNDVNLAQALDTGTRTLLETEGVLADPEPFGLVTTLGESSITIQLFAWVDQTKADFDKVRSTAMQRVKAEYDRLDIDMPEPIYRLRLESQPNLASRALAGETASRETKPPRTPPPAPAPGDITPDTTITDMADQTAQAQGESNLLSQDAPSE